MASIYYANKYHGAKIVAVEPEPGNFEILKRNVAPYPNIAPICAALWSSDGEVRLSPTGLDATPYGRWDYQVNGRGIPVRATTMQTLMRETALHSIDLLKMDVEGGEKEIFADPSWSASVKVCIIELHDHIVPGCRKSVSSAFAEHRIWDDGEMTYFLPPESVP